MNRLALFAFLFFIPAAVWANGTDASKKEEPAWYDKIKIGGELRLREENQLNYAPLTGLVDDDAFVLLRTRVSLLANPVEGLGLFIQPQFSRIFAQEESTIAGNADAGNPNNVFDLHQGYLDFTNIGGSVVSVRAGRQELFYGEGRMVGDFGWSNIGRSFDAGRIRLGWEKVTVDGFFSWNEKAAGNEYFSGLYGSWKVTPRMTYEPYVLGLFDNDGDGTAGVTGLKIVTIGDRMAGTCYKDRIDYSLEGALQVGETEPNSHLAYAGHAASGYTFDAAWKPRIGVEYNFASGNDPGTARQERFNNLFPTNHDKYGFIDFHSWRNIHDIGGGISAKPSDKISARIDYHLFMLPEPGDGLFRASGALMRAGAAGASRLAGHEIDLLAKYQWNKWAGFLGGYSLYRGGGFFDDTGANGTAHFAYIQAQAGF
ncbi:MAG: alginate export family protein [Deltaproteobacteria bacterium]|nr:alginate export family protein [Deltaproteobacteria bacterium]